MRYTVIKVIQCIGCCREMYALCRKTFRQKCFLGHGGRAKGEIEGKMN